MSKLLELSHKRMDRELRRTELAGARLVARVTRKLVLRSVDSIRHGNTLVVNDVTAELTSALSRAMLVAHVAGRERADRDARRLMTLSSTTLSLDALDDVLSRMKKTPIPQTRAVLRAYRDVASKVATKSVAKIADGLRSVIAEQIRRGVHLKTARRAIRQELKKQGALDPGDHLLNTVFRTHTQLASQAAHWQRLEQRATTLWGYEYSTAGDERVRAGHEALDGVILPKTHQLWNTIAPPNGWNCRCYLIPLFDPEPIVMPRDGWLVDRGFRFNPGKVLVA